jgi:hypothetical protein
MLAVRRCWVPWVRLLAIFMVVGMLTACEDRSMHPAYPVHRDIIATVFWVGEPPSRDNGFVGNDASAWDDHWRQHFGGIDDPNYRQPGGYGPAGFRPRENPFYCALPYGEFTDSGDVRPDVHKVYWYDREHPPTDGRSILVGRWVRISLNGRTSYAQWADVGPFQTDDVDYVFGSRPPVDRRAGIDLSPAAAGYLGVPGEARVSWQFVDADEVPAGPWTEISTPPGAPGG